MTDFVTQRIEAKLGSGGHGKQYEDLEPEARESILHGFVHDGEFFNQHLGLRLTDVKKGYAKIEVENVPLLCQGAGVMHGGASFGMADAAVAYALSGLYGRGYLLLTVEMKINYLEMIPLGPVTAEAYVLRASKGSAYAEVDIWAAGKLAARATTTYMIRKGPKRKSVPESAHIGR